MKRANKITTIIFFRHNNHCHKNHYRLPRSLNSHHNNIPHLLNNKSKPGFNPNNQSCTLTANQRSHHNPQPLHNPRLLLLHLHLHQSTRDATANKTPYTATNTTAAHSTSARSARLVKRAFTRSSVRKVSSSTWTSARAIGHCPRDNASCL